ncbi:protein S100-B-like [Osmerus eperlanus]|uniref:protein S100-B-like n=1 Tax=Osmerus eperlanus TaxID=29151 RepID=UPI002E131016
MSDLENAMITIIQVFHKYSGHKCKLKKCELKNLINNELSNFITKIKEDVILDELFADLDQNRDLEIDFHEFIAMIAMVTTSCHDIFASKHHKH